MAACFSYRVATALKCLSLLKKRSTRFLDRYRKGLKAGLLSRRASGLMLAKTPRACFANVLAEKVAVVGAVGDQDLTGAEALKHVGGAPAVVSLSLGQLQGDRQAVGIDEGVDLGGQPASRAPHAAGVRSVPSRGVLRTPFLPFAPCW